MKTARIVLLFVAVVVALTGGYFGANMYMQNMAIKKINNTIQKNHWENLVDYGKVKANILNGNITVNNVEFTLKNNLTSSTIGVLDFKKVVVNGDFDKKYVISIYNAKFVNLNPKLPENLSNKVLFNAEYANFKAHKTQGIVDNFNGYIKDVTINKDLIQELQNTNKTNYEELQRIVKLDNPANVKFQYSLSIDKGIFNIKSYSIDFENNFGIEYRAKVENVDVKGLNNALQEVNKHPKNFANAANIISKFMQMKVVNLDVALKNYGVVGRLLSVTAKKKKTTKEALIEGILAKAKNIPIPSAYPAIKNFITSKSKNLTIAMNNKEGLSLGDLFSKMRANSDILNYLDIKFSN